MAATTRAITPTHTGPFATPNGPTTPAAAAARTSHGAPSFGTHLTNSPRGLSPRNSPQPVSGAMSLSDERQYRQSTSRQASPNHATATSPPNPHPSSAFPRPPPTDAHDKISKPAIVIPPTMGVTGENMQTSPVSLSSYGEDTAPATAASALEASAGSKANTNQENAPPPPQHKQHHHQLIAPTPGDHPSNRAFTFPGPMPPEPDPRAPARQMSLPGYGQNTPKSPSTKRHKCPYCSTDFTRHHNLKSHLLTHSQEKPYECPTCQARFRRLHDLKRHTKLHTGERPHTCFKCGRRFARGDALARHNKGQGGCAGRRSSFGMDDDLGDGKGDGDMDGVVYTGEHDGEEGDDDENDGRRVSEPARKRQNTGNSAQAPMGISSLQNAGQSNVFAQGGMTESPKPLSPRQQEQHRLGGRDHSLPGSRSPNISHPLHQQSLHRGAARGTPPMGLAPPAAGNGPHLPSLPGLNALASKASSQSSKTNGPGILQHSSMGAPPGAVSQPGSMSSQGGSGSSMREVMGGQVDVWQYVREMEARMQRTEKDHTDMIATLQNEVTTLRAQLAQQHVNSTQSQQHGQSS